MSLDAISSFMNTSATDTSASNASNLQGSLGGISSASTEEELLQVCKDFESYFVEEILKEVKESLLSEEEEEDSSNSTLTDFHMDSTVEILADQMVEQTGGAFTQQLFEQMKRNYNIDSSGI